MGPYIEWALEEGFSGAEVISTDRIVFDPSFRPYCAENLCGQYGANHSCPPDCGSPEAMKQKILAYPKALVLETVWDIADYRDKKAIKAAKSAHNAAGIRLLQKIRAEGTRALFVGASGCALCSPCAKVSGDPCRFPDLCYSCMSAYCIYVRKLSEDTGLSYDCGPGKIGFFGMIVYG